MNVTVIDNHDSFTFNLVYDLREAGCDVEVWRNDADVEMVLQRALERGSPLLLSPGPGTPAQAGICADLVRHAGGRLGIVGICLGHQVIVETFGGTVGPAATPVHGRASAVDVDPHPVFAAVRARPVCARYHSLAASALPDELECIAHAEDGTVMAVAHREYRIAGLQFHPESILTGAGRDILRGALDWAGGEDARAT